MGIVSISLSDINGDRLAHLIPLYATRKWVVQLQEQGNYRGFDAMQIPKDWPPLKGVELNPERLYWFDGTVNEYHWFMCDLHRIPGFDQFMGHCDFISVHAPCSGGETHGPPRDLSSLNHEHTTWSLHEIVEAMKFADRIGAQYFNLHPSSIGSNNEHEKARMKEVFYRSFEALCHVYFGSPQFQFDISLENLERPKFPALEDEILDVYNRCLEIYNRIRETHSGFQVGMSPRKEQNAPKIVLDIPHYAHNLLMTWGYSTDNLKRVPGAIYAFIDRYADIIGYYHLAGCWLTEGEHGPYLITHGDIGPIERDYPEDELDLARILSHPDFRCEDKHIILEIHRHQSRCDGDNGVYHRLVRDSVMNVREFVNHRE